MDGMDEGRPAPGHWPRGAGRDGEWLRVAVPCCGRQLLVCTEYVDTLGEWGMRIPHCDRGWTLFYDSSKPGEETQWIEWTPPEGVLRIVKP